MKSKRLEADVVREILLAVGQRDDCRVWRSNTGGVEFGGAKQSDVRALLDMLLAGRMSEAIAFCRQVLKRSTQTIRFGMKGQADITGILCVCGMVGVRLEIEAKTETGRQRKEQSDFEQMCSQVGCIYIIARSAEEAMQAIDEQQARLAAWMPGLAEAEAE